jgi:hypothetical protein
MGTGLRRKLPIPFTTEIFRPLVRPHDGVYIIAAASLQQEHADIWIFREAASHHRSR